MKSPFAAVVTEHVKPTFTSRMGTVDFCETRCQVHFFVVPCSSEKNSSMLYVFFELLLAARMLSKNPSAAFTISDAGIVRSVVARYKLNWHV